MSFAHGCVIGGVVGGSTEEMSVLIEFAVVGLEGGGLLGGRGRWRGLMCWVVVVGGWGGGDALRGLERMVTIITTRIVVRGDGIGGANVMLNEVCFVGPTEGGWDDARRV